MVGDDVPEFFALLLRQRGDAARGVAPAGGVLEGDGAVGVDGRGFEQLFAAPQVFLADDVFFAVGVDRVAVVAAAEVELARAATKGVVLVAPVFVVGGIQVDEAVVVPALLPALAANSFFGPPAASVIAVAVGLRLDQVFVS